MPAENLQIISTYLGWNKAEWKLLQTLFTLTVFRARFCSALALLCWILCCLVSTELSQGLWVSTNRRTSVWPNWRHWERCHSLQWGHDSTANIFPAYAGVMMPHSQAAACLEGRSPCLFANRLRAASPTQVFAKWVSSGPLSLPRALGIGGRWPYSECPAGYSCFALSGDSNSSSGADKQSLVTAQWVCSKCRISIWPGKPRFHGFILTLVRMRSRVPEIASPWNHEILGKKSPSCKQGWLQPSSGEGTTIRTMCFC